MLLITTRIRYNSISRTTVPYMNWTLHISPTYLKPLFSTFIIFQTQCMCVFFKPSYYVKFENLALPVSSTWISLPLNYLILSWSGSFSLWKSQHKHIRREAFFDFPNSCSIHCQSSTLCYFNFLMTPFIAWDYFIYLFMYSIALSSLEYNIVRGRIR